MSNKLKEILVKTVIMISFLLFIGWVIYGLFGPDKRIEWLLFALFFVSSVTMVLLQAFIKIEPEVVKAEKYNLKFESYESVFKFLQDRLNNKNYDKPIKALIDSDKEINLFIKKVSLWEIDCFAIMHINELSDELMEALNDRITDMLKEYYDESRITDKVNMISVFCVNRITPAFQKIVNSNMIQEMKNGRLVTGISFGGKKIYVARQKGGFAIMHYKQMKNEFLEIMNLDETSMID